MRQNGRGATAGGPTQEQVRTAALEDAPAQQLPTCDDVAAANAVAVSGEAIVATFTIEADAAAEAGSSFSDRKVSRKVRKDATLESSFRDAAEDAFGKVGKDYELDSVRWTGSQVEVRIFATEAPNRAPLAFLVTWMRRSWPDAVDKATETTRRKLRDLLRDTGVDPRVTAEWKPGSGVKVTEAAFNPDAGDVRTREYLRELRSRQQKFNDVMWLFVAITVVLVLIGGGLTIATDALAALITAPYAVLFALAGLAARHGLVGVREELREVTETLDLRELLDKDEKRAQRLFQLHSLELKRYYDQALRQRSYIFWLGLVCIGGGFAAVGVAFWLLETSDSADTAQQIIVGAIGAIGAILANYVAVIYLKMFAETIRSISSFHDRLVVTHHVHFGNYLAAKIKDEKMRAETLRAMAVALAGRGDGEDEEEPDPAAANGKAPVDKRKGVLARIGL